MSLLAKLKTAFTPRTRHKPADPFIRDVMEYGIYVLPCGGGVISEAFRALKPLRRKYGHEKLAAECRRILATREGLPEGVATTAAELLKLLDERNSEMK